MEKHRFKFVIPSMVITAVGAVLMLRYNFQEVSFEDGMLIVIFATIFSGFIAYMMFPQDVEKVPDPKPSDSKKKSS